MRWGYDIETQDWDRFVFGAAVSEEGEVCRFCSEGAAAEWYRSLPSSDEVISHNGGSFDFLHLMSVTRDLAWSGNLAGSGIVTCRAKGGALCRDSYRLFPLSLAAWTARKSETGLVCDCPPPDCGCPRRDCGGYCQISTRMEPRARDRMRDYCVNDCRILIEQWCEDVGRLEASGLDVLTDRGMRSTVGGVAWATGARMARGLDAESPIDWDDYTNGRTAYYGGRVEVGRTRADCGHRYDVHAMYPWCLTLDVPYGISSTVVGAKAAKAFDNDPLCLVHATVILPRSDLPQLPHRYAAQARGRFTKDRLMWTTGHVEGVWSAVELRTAVEHGAKIEKISLAHQWSESGPVFKSYVEHVYRERRKAIDAGDKRWGSVLKWFANALSGKLAQRSDLSMLKILANDEQPLEGWERCGAPGSPVYARSITKLPASGYTWIAATLTARARVKLYERLSRHAGRWLYCDTDSTYLLDTDTRDVHESRLGAWGYEGEAREWRAMAPKLYRYRDAGGAPEVRARGVPRACWHVLDALGRGETVTRPGGVERVRSASGRFTARVVTRRHLDVGTGWVGTRHVTRSGVTIPLHRTRAGEYVN